MIDYIKGLVSYIDIHYIVVEANGLGYQVICGNPFHYQQYEGKDIQIFTYQYVREDVLALYGFSTREERSLFLKLLHVSGIGPKGALSVLAAGQPGQVIAAIQTEDVNFLSKFPGIGKKTAQRIILDLKDKLDEIAVHFDYEPSLTHFERQSYTVTNKPHADTKTLQEALEALIALGYSDKEVDRIAKELKQDVDNKWSTDQYLKRGLQLLMK